MKKRILSLLLAMVMTVSLLPTAAMAAGAEKFDDVSKDAWYYKYVDFVAEEGYFAGTSDTTFSPDMTMTRAMFVVVMAALEGVKVNNNVAPFEDVPANTWYSGAVAWAAENGVIAGVGDNKFAPNAEITREQMAVIMNAYINWHGNKFGVDHNEKAKIDTFGDKANVSDWAVDAVDNCRAWGLIVGAPDGNFYPKNSAARAEVATVVYNLAWIVMGGGGGGKTDYIYNSLNKALADLQGDLEDQGFEMDKVKEGKNYIVFKNVSDDKGSFAQISLPGDKNGTVKLSKTIVKAEDGTKTRPQNVDFILNISHDTVKGILDVALKQAYFLVNTNVSTSDKIDAAKVDAKTIRDEIVVPVVEAFEELTGLDISENTVKELVKGTYEYALNYAGSLVAHMKDKDGKYYTGDVTITTDDGTEAVILVDEAIHMNDKAKTAAKMALSIAKEFYNDLITDEKYQDWSPLDAITLDTTITVAFSDNTVEGNKYEKHTNAYPYVYPVTLTMSFNAESLGKLVEYRYDNGNDIMFKIPQVLQAKYEEYAAKAVETVLTSDALKDYAQEKFNLDLDEVMDKAVTEMQGAGAINELKATITELDPTIDADALINAAMNQWIRDNYTNSANLLNYVMTGEPTFNNNALYGLVEVIAKSAANTVTDKVAGLDMNDVQNKLNSASATLADAELLFADKLAELNAAKQQLADGKQQIADAKALLAEKKAEGEKMIADGKAEGEKMIADKKAEAEAMIADTKAEIADAEAELTAKKAELAEAKAELAKKVADAEATLGADQSKWPSKIKNEVKKAQQDIATAEAKAADAETQIADAKAQVADAEAKLPVELAKAETELAKKVADAEAELAEMVADAEAQIKSYEDQIPVYEQMIAEAEALAGPIPTMIVNAKELIADAQNVVDLMNVALTESGPANLIDNLKAVSAAIKAVDMDKAAELNSAGSSLGVSIDVAMLDGKAEMIDAMIAEVEALDDNIEPYVIAAVCDALSGNVIGSDVSYTAPDRNEAQEMHAYIDAMIAEQAEAARDSYMAEMGDAAAEMQAYLDTVSSLLNTFKSFDNIAAISLGDLANVLSNDAVTGLVDSLGQDALVNRATNLIAKLPAGASVTLGGVEISKAALAEVQAAETATEAVAALAGVLEQVPELCLNSFADGEDLVVTAGDYTFTLGLYIVH